MAPEPDNMWTDNWGSGFTAIISLVLMATVAMGIFSFVHDSGRTDRAEISARGHTVSSGEASGAAESSQE